MQHLNVNAKKPIATASCRMKSPQHTFRRRNRYELHPSYHSGTRENRDLPGARDVHPVHRETARATALDRLAGDQKEPRLHGRTRTGALRQGEAKLRRQDEARRHDAPDDHREAAGDLVPGTDRGSSLRRENRLLDHLSLDLFGADRRAGDRAPPKGQAPETDGDTWSVQHRSVHHQTSERGAHTRDIRPLGARHRRLRTREIEGVRRDVRRAEEPVLPRAADRGPQRGLDGGGDSHGPRRLPSGHVQDGDDGPGQGVQLSRARPGDTRRADVFRRPVLVVAARQQRERQRPPARVLPERIGLRDGRPRRDRGRARQDQRPPTQMPGLEDRTRGLHGGSVALNLTNRHLLKSIILIASYGIRNVLPKM